MAGTDDIIAEHGNVREFPLRRDTEGDEERIMVRATPFQWIEPEKIAPRKFLFASRHAIAGHASATGAPGGTGKSSLLVAESLSHCTGRNILNDAPLFRGKAWMLGLEDPMEEHQRRVVAAALLHKIDPSEFTGRFFLDDAEQGFVVAREGRDGLIIAKPLIDGIIERIRDERITLLTVDPFVASHGVPENDNGAIDTVARLWVRIARVTGCAVELCHHLRKGNGNEPSVDDFRGASALIPAVRSARLLATMKAEEAESFRISEPFRFFRVMDGKKNMAPRSSDSAWRELVSIDLRNGQPSDHVAAIAAWRPPDASDSASIEDVEAIRQKIRSGKWRESDQAKAWAGNAVAEVLGLDLRDTSVRRTVKSALYAWISQGVLRVVEGRDERSEIRKFIEVVE